MAHQQNFSLIPLKGIKGNNYFINFSFSDSADSHCLRDYRLHVFSPQCRGLQVMKRPIKLLIVPFNCPLIAIHLSRWQWTSFMAAGSTAGYVFFYSFYYFFFKTK